MKNRNFRTLKGLGQRQAGYTLVELAITVFGMPLFVCYTQVDQPIQLYAVRQEEGYKYYADCR